MTAIDEILADPTSANLDHAVAILRQSPRFPSPAELSALIDALRRSRAHFTTRKQARRT